MFHRIYDAFGDKCEILSGVPKARRGVVTAGEDQIRWVSRLLSDQIVVNIVYREEKKNWYKEGSCFISSADCQVRFKISKDSVGSRDCQP